MSGIFSTTKDLALFASTFLNRKENCNKRILKESSIQLMTKYNSNSKRGLGFDILSVYSKKPMANFFTPQVSFGHTGFTGTSIWIDKKKKVFAARSSFAGMINRHESTKLSGVSSGKL